MQRQNSGPDSLAGPTLGSGAGRLPSDERGISPGLRLSAAALICCAVAGTVAATLGAPPPGSVVNGRMEVDLLAAKALIMTGTDMHVVDTAWIQMAINNYIQPALGGDYTGIPVETPAQFWPFSGPDDMLFDLSVRGGTQAIDAAVQAYTTGAADAGPTVVFGYSQSSIVATAAKRRLAEGTAIDADTSAVSFVMLANPNRPSGGINSRFTGAFIEELGWTFSAATPTDTPFRTIDVARQYDFFADFPRYPLNLLATANAVVALLYGAHDYTSVTLNPAEAGYNPNTVVQQWGDTTYYFIPTSMLPLLRPFRDLGVDPRLLDAAEPALRVLVEFGYDRTTPFGQPAPALLTPRDDVDQLSRDLATAVEQGRAVLEATPATPGTATPGTAMPTTRWADRGTADASLASDLARPLPQARSAKTAAKHRATPISQAPTPRLSAEAEQIRNAPRARPDPSPASRSRR